MENGTTLNNTPEKKKLRFAGLKAEIFINDKLKEICTTVGKLAVYQKGWDDDMLAKFAVSHGHEHIHSGHVKTIRKEMFGPLFEKTGNGKGVPRVTRIAALEKDLTDVMSYLTSKNPHWRTQI